MAELSREEIEAERLRHGSSFGAAAAAYAQHRPGYAQAAVRWALEPAAEGAVADSAAANGPRPPRVVDLGAGTGKLTTALANLGAQVTAVEPDPQMLAELRRTMPSVPSMAGSAEDLPLPDASADVVIAGQAMHWFDMERAIPEIARVLVPGGVLAALWNVDDDREQWVQELAEMSKRKASVTLLRWRDDGAWPKELDAAGRDLFGDVEMAEFEHGQRHTADSLVATIATHSHLLVMDPQERDGLLAQVHRFLLARPETSAGEFTMPMLTVGLRTIKRG